MTFRFFRAAYAAGLRVTYFPLRMVRSIGRELNWDWFCQLIPLLDNRNAYDLRPFHVWPSQCYIFGRNNHGQLGLAGVKETCAPRVVSYLASGASRGAGGVGRHVIKVSLL